MKTGGSSGGTAVSVRRPPGGEVGVNVDGASADSVGVGVDGTRGMCVAPAVVAGASGGRSVAAMVTVSSTRGDGIRKGDGSARDVAVSGTGEGSGVGASVGGTAPG